MATMQELRQHMLLRYDLETELLHLTGQREKLDLALAQGKYAKRQAEAACLEYSGGVKALFDKLTGKYAGRLEELQREAKAAQSRLRSTQRELELLERRTAELQAELTPLTAQGDPLDQAQELPQEDREPVFHLEAMLCGKTLLRLLEENRRALEAAQEWARPNIGFAEEIRDKRITFFAHADECARKCCAKMERIAACGILLEIHPYFLNPAGYILGVAAQFAELDRINNALRAIRETEEQARELVHQLAEE